MQIEIPGRPEYRGQADTYPRPCKFDSARRGVPREDRATGDRRNVRDHSQQNIKRRLNDRGRFALERTARVEQMCGTNGGRGKQQECDRCHDQDDQGCQSAGQVGCLACPMRKAAAAWLSPSESTAYPTPGARERLLWRVRSIFRRCSLLLAMRRDAVRVPSIRRRRRAGRATPEESSFSANCENPSRASGMTHLPENVAYGRTRLTPSIEQLRQAVFPTGTDAVVDPGAPVEQRASGSK